MLAHRKKKKLITIDAVEDLETMLSGPQSIDTLILTALSAVLHYEYKSQDRGSAASEKYAQVLGSADMTVEDALKLNWESILDAPSREKFITNIESSLKFKKRFR